LKHKLDECLFIATELLTEKVSIDCSVK